MIERARDLGALAGVVDLIHTAEIDGVPVLLARSEGLVTGALVFRVGSADEGLAKAGITHLVEHLALFRETSIDVHHNGTTEDFFTTFHATGSVDDVVGFLNGVCRALRELPLSRAEVEKGILRTEAARSGPFPITRNWLERYGARGRGLGAYGALGLSGITTDDLRQWAAASFTSGNAVAWITTEDLPAGLELRLPAGQGRAIPDVDEISDIRPAYFRGADGAVIIDALVPRSSAAALFARVASRLLFLSLRQEQGASYSAFCEYTPIDPKRASLTIFADALHEQQSNVVEGAIGVLSALLEGGIAETELEVARQGMRQMLDAPHWGALLLPSAARDLLVGREVPHPETLSREWADVTVDDVVEVTAQFLNSAIAQVPAAAVEPAGFHPLPQWSEAAVPGRIHPRYGENNGALIIGADGVSVTYGDNAATVLYADCVALMKWPDGARRMVGSDGFQVLVEPTLHANVTRDVVAALDAAVPSSLHVPQPPREPATIPARPVISAPPPTTRKRSNWFIPVAVIFLLLTAVGGALTVNDALHLDSPFEGGGYASAGTVTGGIVVTSVLAGITTIVLLLAVRRASRPRFVDASTLTFGEDIVRALDGEEPRRGPDGRPVEQPWATGPGRTLAIATALSGVILLFVFPPVAIGLGLLGFVLANTAWAHLSSGDPRRPLSVIGQFGNAAVFIAGIVVTVVVYALQ